MESKVSREKKKRQRFIKLAVPAGLIALAVLLCVVWVVSSDSESSSSADESAKAAGKLVGEGAALAEEMTAGQAEESRLEAVAGETGASEDWAGISADRSEEGGQAGTLVGQSDLPNGTADAPVQSDGYDITLSFAGDICFDDTCAVMQNYISQGEKLENNISPALLRIMNEADVCWVNNEFAYSDRGQPLENKMYTFRAAPKRAEMLLEMGADIAGLANNHVYDFGAEAMEDTLDTLSGIGIDYVGAGKNLTEAMTPVYKEVDGIKIAYVAASRAEKFKMTPQATEDAAGILRCYDTALFLEEIRQAREEADFVIALVHWGTEYSTELEEVQITTGREYIDAGADIVIGAHTHCLQGMEYYNGKPILYSLGNFWFNDKSLDSMLLQVKLSGSDRKAEITADNVEVRIVPAKQENCVTRMLEGGEAERLFDYLEGLSAGVEIDATGVVREAEKS